MGTLCLVVLNDVSVSVESSCVMGNWYACVPYFTCAKSRMMVTGTFSPVAQMIGSNVDGVSVSPVPSSQFPSGIKFSSS